MTLFLILLSLVLMYVSMFTNCYKMPYFGGCLLGYIRGVAFAGIIMTWYVSATADSNEVRKEFGGYIIVCIIAFVIACLVVFFANKKFEDEDFYPGHQECKEKSIVSYVFFGAFAFIGIYGGSGGMVLLIMAFFCLGLGIGYYPHDLIPYTDIASVESKHTSIFDVTEDTIRAEYSRAIAESDGKVDLINNPALNHALHAYANQHNCSYDDAVMIALGEKPKTK